MEMVTPNIMVRAFVFLLSLPGRGGYGPHVPDPLQLIGFGILLLPFLLFQLFP